MLKDAIDPVAQRSIFGKQAAMVQGGVSEIKAAQSGLDGCVPLAGRALRDHVDDAARRQGAVQHRGRPLQHLHPFKHLDRDGCQVKESAAITKIIRAVSKLKTAQGIRRISAQKVIGFLDTGIILQDLVETKRLLVGDQIGIDHEHGLGRFHDRDCKARGGERFIIVVALLPCNNDFLD